MTNSAINILMGGEAGQGLATIGEILTKTLVRAGYHIVVTQSYQSRIRGGHNTYAIRVSGSEIVAPQECVDILVCLDEETALLHRGELSPGGVAIVDAAWSAAAMDGSLSVPVADLAARRYANLVALGVAGSLLDLDEALFRESVVRFLSKQGDDVVETNLSALAAGFRWAAQHPSRPHALPSPRLTGHRLMLNGNEAIALGALSAGVKFCAFYPMTPATSVPLTLAAHADRMGIIVEQAEDEIAAINMAIGASFCGAASMVATSGGGFALMTEGVSLAGMTEVPVVLVVAQRPGPSTGLPTRTEQADLEFVLHAGHGEFPRAIFSPGTVEECFHLTRQAFGVADLMGGPVFVLTDQFLADSFRSVARFPVEELAAVDTCARADAAAASPYRTYEISADGVSPRLFPGMSSNCVKAYSSEQLVVADSDEHDEAGHLTEDLSIRKQMVDKRLRKIEILKAQIVAPAVDGDDRPDYTLLSWGSTRGSVHEAAQILRSRGSRVRTIHLPQVWPLPIAQISEALTDAGRTVCIESNAVGQMARLIRRETGIHMEIRVLRYDGLPITPEYIIRELGSCCGGSQ